MRHLRSFNSFQSNPAFIPASRNTLRRKGRKVTFQPTLIALNSNGFNSMGVNSIKSFNSMKMKSHRFLIHPSCMVLALLLLSNPILAKDTELESGSNRPNIVLIYIDDLGYGDISSFGCEDIPTPNIDQLAAEGVRCTASYITNPPCCPSRCSLLMGQYGQRFGKYGMSRGLPIPTDRPTIADFLHDAGYVTAQIGKWDIGTRRQGPLSTGFTVVARNPPRKKYTQHKYCGKKGACFWMCVYL